MYSFKIIQSNMYIRKGQEHIFQVGKRKVQKYIKYINNEKTQNVYWQKRKEKKNN